MDLTQADQIALAIQARHLCTMMRDVTAFHPEDPVVGAASTLAEHAFDFAPIVQNDEVLGHIRLEDLTTGSAEAVGARAVALTSNTLVSGDSAVAELMEWLAERQFLFVVEGREIIGIVTPSDLNKQAGRTYFYLLVAGLEMALADQIRRRFANQNEAVAMLSEARQARVNGRMDELARDDTLADPVAAMDLVDLMTIAKKSPDLLELCGGYTATAWQRKVCGPINGLRNDVMHSVRALTNDDASSLRKLMETERTLRMLLTAMQGM